MAKLLTSILLFTFLMGPRVLASDGEQFFTTVVYGTVAGALVGVATLAFASSPGDNLMNIARGASLGLYTGILLGAYLYYQDNKSDSPPSNINPDGLPLPDSNSPTESSLQKKGKPTLRFFSFPNSSKGISGSGS